MASELVVPIVELKNVRKHPNADALDLAEVLGYQVCLPKDKYKEGSVCVYFPSDTLISDEWADKFGVKKFLRGKDNDRVGRIRLRGEPSFGLVVDLPDDNVSWVVGTNLAEYYGAKKYEPPIKPSGGDDAPYDERIDPFFYEYTDIQNGRLFTDIFKEGEEVVVTEKIHGRNNRVGVINNSIVAGSHTRRKTRPLFQDAEEESLIIKHNLNWMPQSILGVFNLLLGRLDNVIIYGEVYGGSVQSLHYGIEKNKGLGYRAFDISINGQYLEWDKFKALCNEYSIDTVPVLYRGPFSMNKMK